MMLDQVQVTTMKYIYLTVQKAQVVSLIMYFLMFK
jgi:hypothetical protein